MACCLNLPAVTEALIQEGADPHLECGLGSIFQCAILGPYFLTGGLTWFAHHEAINPEDCLETLMILNTYQVPCTSSIACEERRYSPLQLTLKRFPHDHSIRTVFRLLSCLTNVCSVPVAAEDLSEFRKWVDRVYRAISGSAEDVMRKMRDYLEEDPLPAELGRVVEQYLLGRGGGMEEQAAIQNTLLTDDDYSRIVSTALEYDDTESLQELSRDARI